MHAGGTVSLDLWDGEISVLAMRRLWILVGCRPESHSADALSSVHPIGFGTVIAFNAEDAFERAVRTSRTISSQLTLSPFGDRTDFQWSWS